MSEPTAEEHVRETRNTARYFTENRTIAWVVLLGVVAWGIHGYQAMPKRKDPEIPVRVASAVTPWPGTSVAKIEELVTRPIENATAQNSEIHPGGPTNFGIKSLTLPGVSIVQIQIAEDVSDPQKQFSDLNLKLNALNASLPEGAGPIQFNSAFGDTAALLLTVASPRESAVSLSLRARDLAQAIEATRARAPPAPGGSTRATVAVAFPREIDAAFVQRGLAEFSHFLVARKAGTAPIPVDGPGFAALDIATSAEDGTLVELAAEFMAAELGVPRFHADAWEPTVIRDPADTLKQLSKVAGDKYSYAELDNYTDLLTRALQASVPQVANIRRAGVLPEQVFLAYSQERMAAYGIKPTDIKPLLAARNTLVPGGSMQVAAQNVQVQASGDFTSANDIGGVIIARSDKGAPVYMRDLADIHRGYQSPPQFLAFHSWRDANGEIQRSRAVSLAIQMRSGQQIGDFGARVDKVLDHLRTRLPEDLIIVRTSDQPQQVEESLGLFMDALVEAIALVVIVALVGFWAWRAALLIMLAIPLTLALTFGVLLVLGIDLQQVSVATLIIALGLLVDDPVVAGDAIQRELDGGQPRQVAAWLGPTRLAAAIMFATITNVVAYLPLLILTGNQGDFLHSLPIVMSVALIASRLVSMTFIPLLGYYILRPSAKAPLPIEERRKRGFSGFYYRVGSAAIEHRWLVLIASLAILAGGVFFKSHLKNSFFPDDVQYLSYVDLWMRNDAGVPATNAAAEEAERIIRAVGKAHGEQNPGKDGKPREVIDTISTFVGGGAPRFWFSVSPELQQQNYAQLIIRVKDKDDTPRMAGVLQAALSQQLVGATADVRQLQTNPIPYPIEIRISGQAAATDAERGADIAALRAIGDEVKRILMASPYATRVRDDWGEDVFTLKLAVDPDRANLAGITNQDVAASSATGLNGAEVATLREGHKQIPVLARLRPSERATLADLSNLYLFATEDKNKVPLGQVASVTHEMQTQRVRHLEHFRAMSVIAFPATGHVASEVMADVRAQLMALKSRIPPGYELAIGGEEAKTAEGFGQLMTALHISVLAIFVALVFQFKSAVKPLIVLAAVPYGVVAALAGLYFAGSTFGFMAFLGIVSLVGVIVSHVIVLFDFIEEMHRRGEPLKEALLDAGIVRLRPVLVTVGATVLALVPLAVHGGPLWQPLCYAQIGGLTFATVVTLILVPVIYSVCVLDLKVIKWDGPHEGKPPAGAGDATAAANPA